MNKKKLFLEMFIFYFCFPLLFPLGILPRKPIPIILISALILFLILKRDNSFDLRTLLKVPKNSLSKIILSLLISSVLFGIMVLILQPGKLFYFPSTRPQIWLIVMFLYPILSAYPQEVIFRAFFFHRYRNLFDNKNLLIFTSSLAFGLAHILFGNWISVLLSTIGGVIFSKTYLRTNSLMATAIEHSLYGQLIFTIGLGNYFYHGAS